MLRRWFLEHPRSVGESYGQHLGEALSFSLPMLRAGLACAIHALVPCWFETTASRTVAELYRRLQQRAAAPQPRLDELHSPAATPDATSA